MQQRKGECIANYAIYGYMKSPEDIHKLIVDEEAAEIVKRIFNYRAGKMPHRKIALILNNEGILSPSEYKKRKFDCSKKWGTIDTHTFWLRLQNALRGQGHLHLTCSDTKCHASQSTVSRSVAVTANDSHTWLCKARLRANDVDYTVTLRANREYCDSVLGAVTLQSRYLLG